MQKFYGKIEKVYIPIENNQDAMFSDKIGFIIKINGKLYRFETEQNEENSQILREDEVVVIIQTVDNHDFFDVRKLENE
ncbi:unknown [Clostridium sp. CAG:433]|jgi:hypothetical protein|nr:unknown [Clostridium sp. CAG:433]